MMKSYLKIIFCCYLILFYGTMFGQILHIYSNQDQFLFYEKINLEKRQSVLRKKIIDIDIFDYNQKQDFVILNKYEQDSSYSILIRYGDIVDYSIDVLSEIQKTTVFSNKFIFMDSLNSDIENFVNYKVCLYDINSKKINCFKLLEKDYYQMYEYTKIQYLFNPQIEIDKLDENQWYYNLFIIDLINKKSIKINKIKQSNNNFINGRWEFLPKCSIWISEKKLTYLLFFIEKKNIKIQIHEYNIQNKKESIVYNFVLPKCESDINLQYVIKNNKVYITEGKNVYEVNQKNEVKLIFECPIEILGFNIE